MLVKVATAPCDKCGRELTTDEWLGSPYWQAGCADIHADGCHGQADDSKATVEYIEIH
jgi:hypothetical protein